jgi:hypothetical protein
MMLNVLMFAIGCGAAALLFMRFEMWCFMLPPVQARLRLESASLTRMLVPERPAAQAKIGRDRPTSVCEESDRRGLAA